MKRPGGFDRGPGRGSEPAADAARAETPAAAAEERARTPEPAAPARPRVLDRLSAAGRSVDAQRTAHAAGTHGTGLPEPESGPGDPQAPADSDRGRQEPDDTAQTVDLSGVSASGELARGGSKRVLAALAVKRTPREVDPVRAAEKRLRAAERQRKKRVKRESKRFTAQSRRRRRRVLISLATVAGLVLFVLLGALTPVMSVREVRVEGVSSVDEQAVQDALSEFSGVPLALVNETDVLRALEGFPLIQRFAVERIPPKTLVVRIEERVPVIALADGDAVTLYDAAGVVLGEVAERPKGVPLGSNSLRNTAGKGFGAAAKVVRDMPSSMREQLAEVTSVSGQDVTFVLTSGVEVFWGNPEETKRKALVLEKMLHSLGERPVSHIDVSSTESPIFK